MQAKVAHHSSLWNHASDGGRYRRERATAGTPTYLRSRCQRSV